ncbi:hypothetical protein M0R45_009267 [Rubus argutus]|uniref:non-specific serine/threonine protein kinase n=1 Tax=Rubus argutus TaxID=59490 RepID=A0AAW1Y324_RUBAR
MFSYYISDRYNYPEQAMVDDKLPPELIRLPYLQEIDLTRNYLSGTIPPKWGSLPLVTISLVNNRLTGSIPPELGNITTLKICEAIDFNKFTGVLPAELGNLSSIEKMYLTSNNFNGELPETFAKLTTLKEFRISDSSFSGKIPNFIPNWTNLEALLIQASGFTGPIPPSISLLTKLTLLTITDLNGSESSFPLIDNMKSLERLLLRNCNISGQLPEYLGNMTFLKILDLSFNKLTGEFPNNFSSQTNLDSLFLTGNMLTGSVPTVWRKAKIIDLSYNNFTLNSEDEACKPQDKGLNLFASSSGGNASSVSCFPITECPKTYYDLHINCGGNQIIFTNDKTYSSLGRRVFDIYIQGKLVHKDFNIADEAAQFGDAVIKNFTANVASHTLEIRLYWAGKGTTGVPYKGDYGPVISAISVVSNFEPPAEGRRSLSIGQVVGIMAGGVFLLLLIFGILWRKGFLGQERTLEQDLKGVDLQTGKFTLRQIKDATKNFDISNKIGEGGFGPVYKGLLSDGTAIAVKQLSAKSKQGNREFLNEIGMISALQHPHLVKLYGCCIEGNQLSLVYEYMENNSVASTLFGAKENQLKLDWPTRHKICVGIARGLAYLHEESRLKIVHRDIKATNVLLDKNLHPKISDFGMAKLNEDDRTHISTRIAGTYGYMAPEYAMWGYLTDKADVYSFGIVVLEMVSGRCNTTYRSKEEYCFHLLDWAQVLKEKGSLLDLIDPRLGSEFNKEEVMITINVALLCCNASAALRPVMSAVVSMLEGRAPVRELVLDPSASSDGINEMMRKHFESIYEETIRESTHQRKSMSIEGASTVSTSSTSVHDLYPNNPDAGRTEIRDLSKLS